MEKEIIIKCPYCGTFHKRIVQVDGPGKTNLPQVELCHPSRGGCDNFFAFIPNVIKIDIQFQVETFKMEIANE